MPGTLPEDLSAFNIVDSSTMHFHWYFVHCSTTIVMSARCCVSMVTHSVLMVTLYVHGMSGFFYWRFCVFSL